MNSFVIWRDIPVRIIRKENHIKKIGGKVFFSFVRDWGDIPVACFNTVTGKMEEVQNFRGLAYATRNRLKFKKNKKRD
jgi:hypothetical protein